MFPENAPLAHKVAYSVRLLKGLLARFDPARSAVAWTGGKDSTAALHLWRTCLAGKSPLRALSIDTGAKFQEVTAFRDDLARDWNVDLAVVFPDIDISAYPLAEKPLDCCRDLKVKPLKKALEDQGIDLLVTGVRRFENPARENRPMVEKRADPSHTLAHPLLHWTEMDVWSYTVEQDFPYCPLYDEGYRSLGCKPCTDPPCEGAGERSGRNPDKESHMDVLHSLGYF